MRAQHGPRDPYRIIEDESAFAGLSFVAEELWRWGLNPAVIREWLCGSTLDINYNKVQLYNVENYSSVTLFDTLAGCELDRIVSTNKALLYPLPREHTTNPLTIPNLHVAPGHMIAKASRVRWVTNWSSQEVMLNQLSTSPDTDYSPIYKLIHPLRPGTMMCGLDLQDCFAHWLLCVADRRYFGFRHPMQAAHGAFTHLPQGYGPSPGLNDKHIKSLISFTYSLFPDTLICDFVDDLRMIITNEKFHNSKATLRETMDGIYSIWNSIGIRLHGPDKPTKYMAPCTNIDWVGMTIDSQELFITMMEEKYQSLKKKVEVFIDKIEDNQEIRALELAGSSPLSFLVLYSFLFYYIHPTYLTFTPFTIINSPQVWREFYSGLHSL